MAVTIKVLTVPEFEGPTDPRPAEGSTAYRLKFGASKDSKVRWDPAYDTAKDVAGAPVYYDSTRAGSDPSWPYTLSSAWTVQLLLDQADPGGIATWDIFNIPKKNVGDAYDTNFPMAWGNVQQYDPAKSQKRQLLVSDGGGTPKYKDAGTTAPMWKREAGNSVFVTFPKADATYNVVLSVPRNSTQPASFTIAPIVVTAAAGVTSGATPPVDYSVTGVTAGSPGSFTPANYPLPANLAALGSNATIGNSGPSKPGAGWTSGQHVILGDGSHANWSGSAWVAGNHA